MTHILAEIEQAFRCNDKRHAEELLLALCTAKAEAQKRLDAAGEEHRVLWNSVIAAQELFRKYRGQAPDVPPPEGLRPPARELGREPIPSALHAVPPTTKE